VIAERKTAVHLIEPLGRGGIFQHTVALGSALDAAGLPVVIHTATDAELDPRVETCRCVDWHREQPPSLLRNVGIAGTYATSTVRHLIQTVQPSDIVHFEGLYKAGLGAATISAFRCRGRRVVFSPHNTFARSGHPIDRLALRLGIRMANATVVFSQRDADAIRGRSGGVVVSPLVQELPRVEPARVRAWRERWAADAVALVAGQLRPDKGLDVAVAAAAHWGKQLRLVVVGEDGGAAAAAQLLAQELGVQVDWSLEYAPLKDFVAAVAAADVVLCPYSRASQSGVLSLAYALGTPSVATCVGGLSEYATAVVDSAEPEAIAAAAIRVAKQSREPSRSLTDEAVRAHLTAYEIASTAALRTSQA
jgi:glycosyltransferase involved in cell wall biosynthesis